MKAVHRIGKIAGIVLINTIFASSSDAATIYESGHLGTTGVSAQQLFDQTVPGSNVNLSVFLGARFEILQPANTTRVGGHFVGFGEGDSIFGAIIALTGESDLPDSFDLSTFDLLGGTKIDLPLESNEVFGELDLFLSPGWYAVVFGGSMFGAALGGGAVRNNTDIGIPSYIQAQQIIGGWANMSPNFRNHRFVVEGTVIPEPATIVLLGTCGVLLLLKRRRAV